MLSSARSWRRFALAATAIGCTSILVEACGARTALDIGTIDGQGGSGGEASSSHASSPSSSSESSSRVASSSSTGPSCHVDADCDDKIDCTTDVCTEGNCVHATDDSKCDDGLFCTRDRCDAHDGCHHTHDDAICDDGIACTIDACDADLDVCRHDACDSMCDDGIFCNGVERCDTTLGCAMGAPPCQLDLACSTDSCEESTQKCSHDTPSGCTPSTRLVVITKTGEFVRVNPYTGATSTIASRGTAYLDVAILNGRWFAIDRDFLYELKPETFNVLKMHPAPPNVNSLGAGPDGTLYAAYTNVYRIDPDTGASTVIGVLPPNYKSSGDIAFLDDRMFVSADGPCGGALVEVDISSGRADLLGGDGLGCVYGLAAKDETLFVVNCDGKIGTFDPDTGDARVLSTTTLQIYGADAL